MGVHEEQPISAIYKHLYSIGQDDRKNIYFEIHSKLFHLLPLKQYYWKKKIKLYIYNPFMPTSFNLFFYSYLDSFFNLYQTYPTITERECFY